MNSTPAGKPRSWRLPALIFALLTAATYFPVFQRKIPFPLDTVIQFPAWRATVPVEIPRAPVADIGDLVTAFYPFRALAAQAVRNGEFPLWNPYMLAGAPFLANSQSALFYPPTLLHYVLGLPTGWTAAILLRMFLSAAFMWLFVRSIGATQIGAILSGIVFAACGFMVAWQGQPMGDAAIWLPFIFYSVHRLRSDFSARSVALTAVGFAMPVLAGHPETAAHLTLAGLAWALWRGATNRRFMLCFAAASVLAMGLASVQMFATLEWLGEVRNSWDAIWPSLPLHEIFGFVSRDNLRSPNSAGVHIPEAAAYAGMMTLLLAACAMLRKPRRDVVFLFGMVGFAVGVAFGFQAPIVSAIKNWRLILIADFGIAALAGLGLSVLQEEPDTQRKRFTAFALVAAAFVLTFLFVYKLQHATGFRVEFMRRPSFSRALLMVGLVPIVLRMSGVLRGRTFAAIACAIVGFDMLTFAYGYTTFASRADVFPPAPVFDFLKTHADPFRDRIAAVVDPYPVNSPVMYGLASADGYEVRLLRIREFCRGYSDASPDNVTFGGADFFEQDDRRLDLLNIRYFVVYVVRDEFREFSLRPDRYAKVYEDAFVAVFENKRVLPRAFAVPASGMKVMADEEALALLRDSSFDPERMAILSAQPPPGKEGAGGGRPTVDVIAANTNSYTIRTQSTGPAVLVISQIHYPGWRAFVDGREEPVLRANYALSGIGIPSGNHQVRFEFAPRSFKLGLALTAISAVLTAGLFVRRRGASFR